MDIRIGYGYDVHRLEKGEELWIGGILVPSEFGAVGHSDADVVLHVGEDPPDLRQLDYLPQPTDAFGMRVVNQDAHLHTPNIAHPGCAHQM